MNSEFQVLDVYSYELHLWHRPTKCQWTHLSSIDIENFYDFSQRIPLLANHQVIWNTLKSDENCCLNMLFLPFFRMKISENNGFKEIYGLTPLAKVRRIKSSIGPFTPLLLWHISRKSLSLYNQEPLLWNTIIGWFESLLGIPIQRIVHRG